mmetsp:Transcript_22869/g.58819  ORF Transcript_22869/g.58819 Transcript_22869/m.58819 type:complete len:204 (+) Transcript_22869:460-1071(+)
MSISITPFAKLVHRRKIESVARSMRSANAPWPSALPSSPSPNASPSSPSSPSSKKGPPPRVCSEARKPSSSSSLSIWPVSPNGDQPAAPSSSLSASSKVFAAGSRVSRPALGSAAIDGFDLAALVPSACTPAGRVELRAEAGSCARGGLLLEGCAERCADVWAPWSSLPRGSASSPPMSVPATSPPTCCRSASRLISPLSDPT